MGVTADGIPFPEYTDAPDGPKQLAALANWLDAYLVAGGNSAWTSWSPQVTQGAGVTVTNTRSRYMQIGKLVVAQSRIDMASAGTSGNIILMTMPVPVVNAEDIGGSGQVFDTSTGTSYVSYIHPNNTTTFVFMAAGGFVGQTPAFALASGDTIRVRLIYEVA